MSALVVVILATATAQLGDQYQREWQTCVFDTSKIWAAKPGSADRIVDAATIHCRDKFERFMIVQGDKVKAMGLNSAQADEFTAFMAAGLIHIARESAIDGVEQARRR